MKVKVKTSDFQKGIASVDGIISIREIKSILSNIKIEARDNKLFFSATDLEISIKTSIPAECITEGTTSLPAKHLNKLLKTINFENTMIQSSDDTSNQALITDADGKYDFKLNINGLEGEDFKTMPEIDYNALTDFPCTMFKDMIRKTSYSIAHEDTRFVFNGLFLKAEKEQVVLVGTDGRRLALVKRDLPVKMNIEKGIIIPHKAVTEIQKMIDEHDTGKIGVFENQVYFSAGNVEMVCKLIDGNYPDYQQVIPAKSSFNAVISNHEFNVALKQALNAAEEPTRQVRITFQPGNMYMNASTPGTTEVNINIGIEYTGDETTIAFKGDYLSDILKAVGDENVMLEFSGSSTPVLFKDPSDPDFVAVVMPMKV